MTKAQRHKIYKKALRIVIEKHKSICWSIDIASRMLCFDYKLEYHEFYRQKPKGKGINSLWFPFNESGQKKRIAILKKCIKETAPKKKKP